MERMLLSRVERIRVCVKKKDKSFKLSWVKGFPIGGIAQQLSCCTSTISREIQRNMWLPSYHSEAYHPVPACGLEQGRGRGHCM